MGWHQLTRLGCFVRPCIFVSCTYKTMAYQQPKVFNRSREFSIMLSFCLYFYDLYSWALYSQKICYLTHSPNTAVTKRKNYLIAKIVRCLKLFAYKFPHAFLTMDTDRRWHRPVYFWRYCLASFETQNSECINGINEGCRSFISVFLLKD